MSTKCLFKEEKGVWKMFNWESKEDKSFIYQFVYPNSLYKNKHDLIKYRTYDKHN